MSAFNKKYVYFMRDEELCGRYGYFADSIDTLVDRVTSDYHRYWGKMSSEISNNCAFPFVNEEDGNNYKFFYSDPKWNICTAEQALMAGLKVLERYNTGVRGTTRDLGEE